MICTQKGFNFSPKQNRLGLFYCISSSIFFKLFFVKQPGGEVAMGKRAKIVVVLLYAVALQAQHQQNVSHYTQKKKNKHSSATISKYGNLCFPRKPSPRENFLGGLWRDIINLNKYALFSFDSYKVVTLTFPMYVITRMFDEKLQSHFHKNCCKRDVHQAPAWCRTLSQYGLGIPMTTLGLMTLFGKNEEFRTTGRIFLVGMPFVIWGKDIIKKFRFDANRRPWCDRFPCQERALGGFPSGHMAEVTYMTVLYGLRYGFKAAVPLGIFSTFLGVTFLNCNRHYASQLVAGAGLGTLFALAADKVIDVRLEKKYKERFSCGFDTDLHGSPALKVAYSF